MKGLIIKTCMILSICLCALQVSAWEMYLQDGLKWEEEDIYFGTKFSHNEFQVTYHQLIKEKEVDGDVILQEWVTHDPNHTIGLKRYRIKVSGDKVYLYEPSAEDEWLLLYDFSIMPGETRNVVIPNIPNATQFTPVYCISADDGELPGLKMIDESYIKFLPYASTGVWILGLGNNTGIFHFSAYNMSGCGFGWRMMRNVTLNGTLIYAGVMASIDNPEDSAAMPYEYYDMMGNRRVDVNTPGVYLKVKGNNTEKFIVK